ncbi:MAG: LysR substrate-binding domain-containing protein [Solirubrobacteraceae bacterium]
MSRPARGPGLVELRAYCAAVELGSVGRAARILHISQPTLSRRLRVLEKLANVRLLERSHGGVSPTPAGTRLYLAARRVLAEDEAIEGLMGGVLAHGVPARLAASPTMAESVLPKLLADFEERYERHLSIELTIVSSAVVRELVSEGRVDLGLAVGGLSVAERGSLAQIPLCEDEVVVIVPRDHPWAALEEIDRDEFLGTRMIMRDPRADTRHTVDAGLRPLGLSLSPPLAEIGNTAAAKDAALREHAPALLSRLAVGAADERLLVRRVAGLRFRRRFVLLYSAKEGPSPLVRAFADQVQLSLGVHGGPQLSS